MPAPVQPPKKAPNSTTRAANAPTPAPPDPPAPAAPPAIVSPAKSFAGYSFRVWLVKNKESLKELVSITLGVVTAFLPQIKDTTLSVAAGAAVKIVAKLALDALDFYLSEVPADQ